jgi:hypothetical protein
MNCVIRRHLGRWTAGLDELLDGNAAKPSREQPTLIRLFEELRERGHDGGYGAVRRQGRRSSSGSLAMLAAIRRASSLVRLLVNEPPRRESRGPQVA